LNKIILFWFFVTFKYPIVDVKYEGGTNLIKKILIFSIIFLFLCICVQPSIAIVQQNNNDDEYYCVTTRFVGFNKKHSIFMTYEKIQELETFLKKLCLKLEKAESREETLNVYNNGLMELYKYGLIDKKNIKLAQMLITSRYKKSWSQPLSIMDDNENKLCITIGKTSKTIIDGIPFRFFANILDKTSSDLLLILIAPIFIITDLIDDYRPIFLDAYIYWGAANENWGQGWIWTLGINGIKSWNGKIIGRIWTVSTYFTGIVGFSGINIMINGSEDTNFFLGFARHVKIDYKN
jgi:hypothetical protein